jgi:hypothetical protein
MRFVMIPVALAMLSACGPSTTRLGEISGFGLVYDQRPGRSFEGLPRTTDAQMPTTIGTMTGPSRLISNDGTIVFADATLTVYVTTRDVTLTGEYEFPDTHPLGIIQIQQDGQFDGASITGTATSGSSGYLSGDFYGTDGTVSDGFFG